MGRAGLGREVLDEGTPVLDPPRLLEWNAVALEGVEFGSGGGTVTGVSDDDCSLGAQSNDKVIERVLLHEGEQRLLQELKGLLEVPDLHEVVPHGRPLRTGSVRDPQSGIPRK